MGSVEGVPGQREVAVPGTRALSARLPAPGPSIDASVLLLCGALLLPVHGLRTLWQLRQTGCAPGRRPSSTAGEGRAGA